jgi:hypothetical protein
VKRVDLIASGDLILFRGRRRFVVLERPGGLSLERLRKIGPHVVYYSVSNAEKKTIRVVRRGTVRDATRARKLIEDRCLPWTHVRWNADGQPAYMHDVAWI